MTLQPAPRIDQRITVASHRYTPQQLIDAGFLPVPMDPRNPKHVLPGDTPDRVYTAADFAARQPVQLRTGRQPNGRYLNRLDLDKHRADQDPAARLQEIRRKVGEATYHKLCIVKSTNGEGRDVLFHTLQPVQSTVIYNSPFSTDSAGELIGIGNSQRAPVPYTDRCVQGSLYTIPTLSKEDLTRLLDALYMPARASDATILGATERKADIREGRDWCGNWDRQPVPELRSLLTSNPIGRDLLGRFDALGSTVDRSKEHANLVQHLMLRATKEGPHGFVPRCRWVARLAITGNAYGKGSEREYNLENDTFALMSRIARGAAKLSGGRFIQPAWCKSPDQRSEVQAITEPEQAPRNPGRPAGERKARIAKLRRELRKLAVDDQVTTKVAYLAERLNISRRSIQSYLRELADVGEIETAQIGGNGGLYVLLKVRFGGASNYHPAKHNAPETAKVWCADATDDLSTATLQSADQVQKHKEEGTPEPCAPPCAPPSAAVAADNVLDAGAAVRADAVGVQHSGAPSPAARAILSDLRTLVREAFDVVPRLYANTQTGELGKITCKRVMLFVEDAGALCDRPTCKALIVEERRRREALTLKALSFDGLRAELRKAESLLGRATRRNEPIAWLLVRRDLLQAEMRTRPDEPEQARKLRRKGGPAKPDQRAAARQVEADLLDELDAALGRTPIEQPQTDVQQPSIYTSVGLVDRLKLLDFSLERPVLTA